MTKPANDTIITIWLTNLGAYAGGQLIDCELNLPCDPEEIDEALKKSECSLESMKHLYLAGNLNIT